VQGEARCLATRLERMRARAGEEAPAPPPPSQVAPHPQLGQLIAAIQGALQPHWPSVW